VQIQGVYYIPEDFGFPAMLRPFQALNTVKKFCLIRHTASLCANQKKLMADTVIVAHVMFYYTSAWKFGKDIEQALMQKNRR
jgi:hypothetical protein